MKHLLFEVPKSRSLPRGRRSRLPCSTCQCCVFRDAPASSFRTRTLSSEPDTNCSQGDPTIASEHRFRSQSPQTLPCARHFLHYPLYSSFACGRCGVDEAL